MTYFLFWNNTYTSFPSDKILREVSPIHTKQSEDILSFGHSDVWTINFRMYVVLRNVEFSCFEYRHV